MSINVNVLVNGHNCKQYNHEEKCFIEAKENSEYEIEIKNNNYFRVLAIVSVDGLSVISGKSAGKNNDSGYVINSYDNLKIKGFRYSNDAVGAFKFTLKEDSYAASKGNNSEKNCGIIGVKIYDELVKPQPIVIEKPIYIDRPVYPIHPYDPNICYPLWTTNKSTGGGLYGAGRYGYSTDNTCLERSLCCCSTDNFDLGTEWGTKKESKVENVEFEKGCLIYSTNIYYASRQSLVNMGIPLYKKDKIWPQSFPEEYATPPSGWNG